MTRPGIDDRRELWTIGELAERVADVLAVDYAGPTNERVRAIPDTRTIRYYTTLGLLDRAAAMEGRTALYSRRHVAQLVAIKRMQALGLSLAEIQARMVGMTDAELESAARLPGKDGGSKDGRSPGHRHTRGTERVFWGEGASPPQPGPRGPTPLVTTKPFAGLLAPVALDDDLVVLVPVEVPPDEEDLAALRNAAISLARTLRARGLVRGRELENGEDS
jgi:DNA-binding transcriptional MerR regulator